MSISAACLPVLEASVRLESDADGAVALLTVQGRWGPALWDATSTALRDCLCEHPEALIVDLTGLVDPRAESVPAWVGAQRSAAELEPPLQLALCVPARLPLADHLQRQAAGRFLPVYAKVSQARVAIAGRLPSADRVRLTLPPDPETPSIARNLVGDACLSWGLGELLHPARLVMSELVTNAVEHAGTEMTVAVSRRGAGLHLSVSDETSVLPRLRRLARPRRDRPLDERGRGLQTVAATAAAWGSLPTRTGKVVWATLR
jgi:anti-sigma regulatory factor (Ser/Thr protein kinase)